MIKIYPKEKVKKKIGTNLLLILGAKKKIVEKK